MNAWEFNKKDNPRFRIYFSRLKSGYHILCQIENGKYGTFYGIMDHGKVYDIFEGALEYAIKYVMHNKKYYDFMIDCQIKEHIK